MTEVAFNSYLGGLHWSVIWAATSQVSQPQGAGDLEFRRKNGVWHLGACACLEDASFLSANHVRGEDGIFSSERSPNP
jgi:hypothetical protein